MAVVYRKDGKVVSRSEWMEGARGLEAGAAPGGMNPACWPMWSDAAGCNPDQKAEVEAHARRHGLPSIEVNDQGQVKFDSPQTRKKYCELVGLFDRNGGYGDPQRR